MKSYRRQKSALLSSNRSYTRALLAAGKDMADVIPDDTLVFTLYEAAGEDIEAPYVLVGCLLRRRVLASIIALFVVALWSCYEAFH